MFNETFLFEKKKNQKNQKNQKEKKIHNINILKTRQTKKNQYCANKVVFMKDCKNNPRKIKRESNEKSLFLKIRFFVERNPPYDLEE